MARRRRAPLGGALALALATAVAGGPAAAAPAAAVPEVVAASSGPFERPLSAAAYGVGWAGTYPAAGPGGRLSWELLRDRLGLDLFLDHLFLDADGRRRHDHSLGFNAWVPFRPAPRVRVRPLLGMCAVLSFIEPREAHGARSDDVLLGAHGGVGVDVALRPELSVFADFQAFAWVGHPRDTVRWSASVGDDLRVAAVAQLAVGLQLHLGR